MSEFEKSPTPRPLIRPGRCRRDFWSPRSFVVAADLLPVLPSAEGLVTVQPPSEFRVLARAKGDGNPLGPPSHRIRLISSRSLSGPVCRQVVAGPRFEPANPLATLQAWGIEMAQD